jgi:hypothetical protein
MAQFSLLEYQADEGRLILITPSFDYDSFPVLGERLVTLLSAQVIEKQADADIHSWLIDFEDCHLMLKAEHYSEAVWLEALAPAESREEMGYLAGLFRQGF